MKGIQDTSSETLRQLMGNGLTYEVPRFQRDYSWEEEQWEDLWQDMLAVYQKQEPAHYLGYLVLQSSDDKNFRVIDGQQRLTTLSILVLAILESLKKLEAEGKAPDANAKRREALRSVAE